MPVASSARPSASRWLEAGLLVLFWGSIFMLTVGQRAIDPRGPQGLMPGQVIHTGLEYLLWLLLTPAIFWLCRRFSLERDTWPRHLALHIGVALAVAIAINAFTFSTYFAFIRTDREPPFGFAGGVLSLRFLDELVIYLLALAAGFARDYFLRYQARRAEAEQLHAQAAGLQVQLTEARLQALRMQLNPHFLFNTLHAVSSLVERDPRGVRRIIARLSELLRYSLDGPAVQEVPLRRELPFLEGYLEIQRIRFQGRLTVTQDFTEEALDALVPTLLLQPLIENAVKHGTGRIEAPGQLVLRGWRADDALHLSVQDNGPGLPTGDGAAPPPAGAGVGLPNTRARLEALYGDAQHFALRPAPEGGLIAEVVLPYHTAADLYTTALAPTP